MKENKVKYGLCNVHYVPFDFNEDGKIILGDITRYPGAVSLSMSANGEAETFYADNIDYYVINNNSGYDGDLETALVPPHFATNVLGEEIDEDGIIAESTTAELKHFMLLFEFTGDQKRIRHCFYNCTASRVSVEGSTTTETKEVKTETLKLKASPLSNGLVKIRTCAETKETVYDDWYKKIHVPEKYVDILATGVAQTMATKTITNTTASK